MTLFLFLKTSIESTTLTVNTHLITSRLLFQHRVFIFNKQRIFFNYYQEKNIKIGINKFSNLKIQTNTNKKSMKRINLKNKNKMLLISNNIIFFYNLKL